MPIVFVDSNFFLQCKDRRALPWRDLFESQKVLLLIPRATQEEIDRIKHDGNSRRAKRARKTSTFFREMIESPYLKSVIRDSAPRVEMSFAPILKRGRAAPPTLDLTRADDRIVDDALAYAEENPNET